MAKSDKLFVENGIGGINGIRSEETAERKKVFVCNFSQRAPNQREP